MIRALVALVSFFLLGCREARETPSPRVVEPHAQTAPPRSASPVEPVASAGAAAEGSASAAATLPPQETRPWPPPPPGVKSEFCIELVNALDEDSCYVLPDAPTTELLLYLHGTVPPARTSVQKTNFETVVTNASRRAGVAALMPRGRRGLAPKGYESWWGWPTSADSYRTTAKEFVAGFADKIKKLEALTGRPFTRLFVAGSSSGAYFVAALALTGDLRADGFGAISGGAARGGAESSRGAPTPFYVGYGTFDSVGPSSQALAERLRSLGWPVKVAVHRLGHGAAEVYLDEAFALAELGPGNGRALTRIARHFSADSSRGVLRPKPTSLR